MKREKIILSQTDLAAIEQFDSNHINNKGAKYYQEPTFYKAVEYYRLASAMGNIHAIANLGYCYLYGRDIEQNTDLAIAYLKIAALRKDVDAAYKLGDIYNNTKWGLFDKELSIYYYRMAASLIINDEWEEGYNIAWCSEFKRYPSLCFALGREMSVGGSLTTDVKCAYEYLKYAEYGYHLALTNGDSFYQKCYCDVAEMLESKQFDEVREEIDEVFIEEVYDNDYYIHSDEE